MPPRAVTKKIHDTVADGLFADRCRRCRQRGGAGYVASDHQGTPRPIKFPSVEELSSQACVVLRIGRSNAERDKSVVEDVRPKQQSSLRR
jgi:hypothetical protein